MAGIINLQQWVDVLRQHGEIIDIFHEVDPHLEIAEIHRRIAIKEGPALLFHRVKNSSFPVITNLFGSSRRVELAFEGGFDVWLEQIVNFLTKNPPSLSSCISNHSLFKRLLSLGTRKKWLGSSVVDCEMPEPDLNKLPLLQLWPEDGGHFVTLPLVYTEHPVTKVPNLGMYRIQRYDAQTTGLHFQIGKGGGFHYFEAEKLNQPLPVNVFIGGSPALILSAILPLPENVPEILMASLLQDQKLAIKKKSSESYPLFAECEFALIGKALPHERRPEGPFGDHYGYYSLTHPFPVFHCEKIYHRKNAMYPATVVGKPRQEDYYIGNYIQKTLAPVISTVMPGVKSLWSYGETGFHSLGAAVIQERFYRESMVQAFRILGEGQLSLTKFLLLTDVEINLQNFKLVLTTILERFNPQTDLFVFNHMSFDTLDYTGPELNKGSRGVLIGCGKPIRKLTDKFIAADIPTCIQEIEVFTPGCLLLALESNVNINDILYIFKNACFEAWPLIFIVDDPKFLASNKSEALWTIFTRFNPASDIYTHTQKIIHHHVVYEGPILIDARMKSSYPAVVECDPKTAELVDKNWKSYFS